MLIPVSESNIPVIPAKRTLKILFSFRGVTREAFWLKYTKKGDFLISSRVRSNRKMRGNAQVFENTLSLQDVVDLTDKSNSLGAHNYLTLHPSSEAKGHSKPKLNGLGGFSGTAFDLGRMVDTKEIMGVLLTDPAYYPMSFSNDFDVRFGDIYRGFCIPEFRIYATAIKDQVSTDYAIPFVENHSADFLMETSNFDYKHILIQLRLIYRYGGFFSRSHVFLVPTLDEAGLDAAAGDDVADAIPKNPPRIAPGG